MTEAEETAPKDDARHAEKMAKKKAARDKIMATKTDEKGLIVVHTGKGKGKSTAAFGMIFRHIAHGMPSAVVQFIKGGMSTGERDLILARFRTFANSTRWARALPGKRRTVRAMWRQRRPPGPRRRS